MRKIILLVCLIFLYAFVIKQKSKGAFAEKIDLKLEQDEIGILIFNYENEDLLLFKENEKNTLLLINAENKNKINNILNVFDSNKISNLVTYPNISFKLKTENIYDVNEKINLEDIKFIKNDNLLKVNLYDYSFCIYENGDNNDIDGCTFIYFKDIDENLEITDQNKVVFYKESVDEQFEEKLYTKWVDSYSLDSDVYTILKVKNNNYNIINIPVE